jgi:uncharacterized 2Fe-2S/4Fe-4S cluster protein (DUF4445 family)
VRAGSLIVDAIQQAGLDVNIPCGGQGRCGRCAVIVEQGQARRRSTVRLSPQDVAEGYALACQTVIESDLVVTIPPQEKIERRLKTDKTAAKIALPFPYDAGRDQPLRKIFLHIEPPNLGDNTDDLSRVQRELAVKANLTTVTTDLDVVRTLARTLRQAEWDVTAVLDVPSLTSQRAHLMALEPGDTSSSLWGAAIDIGTTTVTVYLVDLLSGEVRQIAADYNGQIARGEDVISRIIYSTKDTGLQDLTSLVVGTINRLLGQACRRQGIEPGQVYRLAIVGNSTMMHLLLGLPPEPIRLTPYITTANFPPLARAAQIGLVANPQAVVDCLPGVASFMGADITAGVLSTEMDQSEQLTLFLDIGTNGEMVLGTAEWLVSCACSAGPAFEGAGVEHGMRATMGAIEEVWVNAETAEPTYRVIGNEKPRGLCGSGLISLLSELFITGVVDRAGGIKLDRGSPRLRQGAHGPEYVVAWGSETADGQDIALTKVDIDNLLRAKAAIYAGFAVLVKSVGLSLDDVEQVLIGGSFGQYINVEKAIQIGLLPDLPWERFRYLGNTAARGAYMALLSADARQRIGDIARRMTYIELCADNSFTEEFMAAMFLPHTNASLFPSVAEATELGSGVRVPGTGPLNPDPESRIPEPETRRS